MEIKSKYKVGQSISFKRNDLIKSSDAKVIAIEKIYLHSIDGFITNSNYDIFYLIESQYGFHPDEYRIKKYGFDKNKKYIFIKESETI